MRLPPYPKYRSSGVEWLGDVPEHWGVKPLKYALSGILSGGTPEVANDSYWAYNDEPGHNWVAIADMTRNPRIRITDRRITEAGRASKDLRVAPPGTLLYSMYASLGKVAVLEVPAAFNQAILALLPDKDRLDQGFLAFWLNSMEERLELFSSSNTQDNLNAAKVRSMPLFVPEPDEQRAIADFLDLETAKIDTLVAKKRTLIERLKEKRTALISRTVTRGLPPDAAQATGLDPHPKLKPSGIDWLGDVPEHWDIATVRRRATRVQTGSTPPTSEDRYYEDGTIPWYGPGSFDDQIVLTKPVKVLHESAAREGVARVFARGATFIVTIGATLGKVSSICESASCNQQITALEFDSRRVHARFMTYQLKRLEPSLRAIAPSATLPILDQEAISDLAIALPALNEQQQISAFLDRETACIDEMVAKVEIAIERLQEYRTALITSAVTGKIDVRAAVA